MYIEHILDLPSLIRQTVRIILCDGKNHTLINGFINDLKDKNPSDYSPNIHQPRLSYIAVYFPNQSFRLILQQCEPHVLSVNDVHLSIYDHVHPS